MLGELDELGSMSFSQLGKRSEKGKNNNSLQKNHYILQVDEWHNKNIMCLYRK